VTADSTSRRLASGTAGTGARVVDRTRWSRTLDATRGARGDPRSGPHSDLLRCL